MISLMSKGQKFVPVPSRIDLTKKYCDFLRFCWTIRLAMLFKDKQLDYDLAEASGEPWIPKSSFQPEAGGNEAVEKFLAELYCKLFDPQNRKKVKPNLSREEKLALSELKNWNRDTDCPRVIRIQDKGSKFVIDWKSKYIQNVSNYIGIHKHLGKKGRIPVRSIGCAWNNGQINSWKGRNYTGRSRLGQNSKS